MTTKLIKLLEAFQDLTRNEMFLIGIIFVLLMILIVLISINASKKRTIRNLVFKLEPYSPWEKLENGNYVIPILCKLYSLNADTNRIVPAGTVATNFKAFSKKSLGSCLQEAYYSPSAKFERGFISVHFINASADDDFVLIETELKEQFFIKRSECKNFPSTVEISFDAKAVDNQDE